MKKQSLYLITWKKYENCHGVPMSDSDSRKVNSHLYIIDYGDRDSMKNRFRTVCEREDGDHEPSFDRRKHRFDYGDGIVELRPLEQFDLEIKEERAIIMTLCKDIQAGSDYFVNSFKYPPKIWELLNNIIAAGEEAENE